MKLKTWDRVLNSAHLNVYYTFILQKYKDKMSTDLFFSTWMLINIPRHLARQFLNGRADIWVFLGCSLRNLTPTGFRRRLRKCTCICFRRLFGSILIFWYMAAKSIWYVQWNPDVFQRGGSSQPWNPLVSFSLFFFSLQFSRWMLNE